MSGDVIHSASYHRPDEQETQLLSPLRRMGERYGARGLLALAALFTVSIGGYGFAYFLLIWLA